MPADERVYSDEEFALILKKATELASRAEPTTGTSVGLTLSEMKAAAAQVGFDPSLIERAARVLAVHAPATPLERLIGGPLRHDHSARFPVKLDENGAALLLSAVRISGGLAGGREAGHSGSMGMAWHDGGDMEALRVTARPEGDGAVVTIVLDRRGPLTLVAGASGVAMFFGLLFAGSALYPEAPAQGFVGAIAAIVGPLAIARSYWASSTRRARERISGVMEVIGQTLAPPKTSEAGPISVSTRHDSPHHHAAPESPVPHRGE